jgi:hypothetical protein
VPQLDGAMTPAEAKQVIAECAGLPKMALDSIDPKTPHFRRFYRIACQLTHPDVADGEAGKKWARLDRASQVLEIK